MYKLLQKIGVLTLVSLVCCVPVQALAAPVTREDVLMLGDRNNTVYQLQQKLYTLNYLSVKPTGYYGTDTQKAVIEYQSDQGLTADGKAGPVTQRKVLGTTYKNVVVSTKAAKSDGYTAATDPNNLKIGSQGASVSKLQQRLKDLKYYTHQSITGYYGTITKSAVYKFQKQNGVDPDGVAGAATQAALYASSAKPYDAAADQATQQSNIAKGQRTAELAQAMLGRSYAVGGMGPNSFDCSGLVYYILKQQGLSNIPRTSSDMSKHAGWKTVSRSELRAGDLLFFDTNNNGGVGHVGIYIGNGTMVDASTSRGKVVTSSVTSGYYLNNFVNAKRVFYD